MSYCANQPPVDPEKPHRIECTPCACAAQVKAELAALEIGQAS